jgi:hypothetical protein
MVTAYLTSNGYAAQNAVHEDIIYKARDSVLSYFDPLNGRIEEIENGDVKVKIDSETPVKRGMRFSVFREGAPIYHPVTNEILGRSENFVGRIEVREKDKDSGLYLCSVVKGDIKVNDKIRITSSKIKLAFFQERKADWAVSESFYRALKNSERFEILEAYTPTYEPDTLSKLARELGAEAVLLFSTHLKHDMMYLDIKLYWSEDTEMFAQIEETLDHSASTILRPEERFIISSVSIREPWASYKLSKGRLIAAGDVDNNGKREFVISDGNNIKIYSLNDELQELWLLEGSAGEIHLSLDILDLNKNGISEIFVTSLIDDSTPLSEINDDAMRGIKNGKMVSSYVIEYDPSKGYKKIADNIPYFFRVINKTLLMQKYTRQRVFTGPVYEGEWTDREYRPGKAIKLPEGVNIYGFTFVDWKNSGNAELISFDDEGYLNLYNQAGELIWKSSKTYGKFFLSFKNKTYSMVNPTVKWAVRGRLITIGTERGQEVIVVNKVPLLSSVPGLGTQEAEVYSLWWNEGKMEERLILSGMSGSVTDYLIEGPELFLIARGDTLTFIKNAVTGEFSKGSIVYYYNFRER